MQSINICQITTKTDHIKIPKLANLVRSLKAKEVFPTKSNVRELHMYKTTNAIKEGVRSAKPLHISKCLQILTC